MRRSSRTIALFTFFLIAPICAASARILTVGPSGQYKLPSQAAAAALAGDTIQIAPGIYTDSMFIKVNDITITATGPGVVLQNQTYKNKGIITIISNNVVVNGLTLQGATSTDLNGAGIRELGNNLTVTNTTFRNDQMGILGTANNPNSTIVVRNSVFTGNGSCGSFSGGCHSIYIGRVTSLDVENSQFSDQIYGHYIKSRALNTVINGNSIQDGTAAHSSYLISIPNGGNVTITNNTLEKGPHSQSHCCAITIGEDLTDPLNPTSSLVIQGNKFTNDTGFKMSFVRNLTKTPATLIGNTLIGNVIPLTGPGTVNAAPVQAAMISPFSDPKPFYGRELATGDSTWTGNWNSAGASPRVVARSNAAAVPEPWTIALFGAGLAGISALWRRRRSLAVAAG
jgi:hypothetical protein